MNVSFKFSDIKCQIRNRGNDKRIERLHIGFGIKNNFLTAPFKKLLRYRTRVWEFKAKATAS